MEVVEEEVAVNKFQEKVVAKFLKLFQLMYQDSNVKLYKDKFQDKIVNKYQDKTASQYQDKIVKVFQFRFLYNKGEESKEQFVKLLIHAVTLTVVETVEVVGY